MKIKYSFQEILFRLSKGELHSPIPTYNLNSFFFLREKENNLVVIDFKGKTHRITERIFCNSQKKIERLLSGEKVKLSQNNNYVYSILRELNKDKNYTPIDWKEICRKIKNIKFGDFVEFLQTKLGAKRLKSFEQNGSCKILFFKDSISIKKNNESIQFLTRSNFENIKCKLCELLSGDLSLEDIIEIIGDGLDLYGVYNDLRNGNFTEILVKLIFKGMGNYFCPFIGGIVGTYIGREIGKYLNKKFNTDEKIKKALDKTLKFLTEKVSVYISKKETEPHIKKVLKRNNKNRNK